MTNFSRGASNIMGVHDANVRKYGKKKANWMLLSWMLLLPFVLPVFLIGLMVKFLFFS